MTYLEAKRTLGKKVLWNGKVCVNLSLHAYRNENPFQKYRFIMTVVDIKTENASLVPIEEVLELEGEQAKFLGFLYEREQAEKEKACELKAKDGPWRSLEESEKEYEQELLGKEGFAV